MPLDPKNHNDEVLALITLLEDGYVYPDKEPTEEDVAKVVQNLSGAANQISNYAMRVALGSV